LASATCRKLGLAYDLAMTRFVFLTDTHLGARNHEGYRQQPRHIDRLPVLLQALDAWICAQDKPVAFALHGGDMVETTSAALVKAATETFRLSVPIYLSLGNHDLTTPGAPSLWLHTAPDFFPGEGPAFTLHGEGWRLHVLPSQWGDTPYLWDGTQQPHILPEHLARLESALLAEPDVAHLICTHAEVAGVPPEQTGFEEVYHAPSCEIRDIVVDLGTRYSQLKGVFGGHNHINTHSVVAHAHAVTASAFTETPFEFKLVEVTRDRFAMRTIALLPAVRFGIDYRWDKTFVQGRACDRAFCDAEFEP
jgi:hypothetical protein